VSHAGRAQVVERAQHVIVPERRKRELGPRRVDDLAVDNLRSRRRSRRYSCARLRASVTADEAPNACSNASSPSSTQIVVWNDERTGAALRLAVPAAVRELFTQQSVDESIARLAEVGAERDDAAVDARLNLTLEER